MPLYYAHDLKKQNDKIQLHKRFMKMWTN